MEEEQKANGFRVKWGQAEVTASGRDTIIVIVLLIIGGALTWMGWVHHKATLDGNAQVVANQTAILSALQETIRVQREGDAGIIWILSRNPEEREKLNLQEPEAVRRLRRYDDLRR